MALVEHIGPDLKAIDYTIPRTETNHREGALPGIGPPTPLTSTGDNIRDLQLCMRSVKRIDFSSPETYLLSNSLQLKTLNLHSRFRSSFGTTAISVDCGRIKEQSPSGMPGPVADIVLSRHLIGTLTLGGLCGQC